MSLTIKASMMAPTVEDVGALFNRKATSWPGKYGPGGALLPRLERLVARLSEVSPPPGKMLDFGCATGEIAVAIHRMGYDVTGCDIAEEMLEVARRTHTGTAVEWIRLTPGWRALPFKDCGFDGAVASSVFEYVVDVQYVATELSRVLRPGGILLLSVPNPFNFVRRLEGLLRMAVSNHRLPSLLRRVHPIDSYATYLRLSRNRFRGDWWQSVLASAHFAALDERDFSNYAWRHQAKARLILLAVRRV
jgi:ubiquinone/menaquinone biosynthesis C-methylase UbiE